MITHSRPSLEQEDIQAVTDVLQSGHLVQGPLVERFERGVAAMIGVKGATAVSSGTAALELALRAMGVGPGDEVILPSYVCAAPWLATTRVGAQPRVVDINLGTYSIDPLATQKAVTARTMAIIVPHMFGLPADMPDLKSLGIPLIEDCAQTLGASVNGRPVGTMGNVAVCSFRATKLLCTGEGGMVLSDDEGILEQARALRDYDEGPSLEPTSFNHKLTDLQAALGLSQLHRFQSFLERRAAVAASYQQRLGNLDINLPSIPQGRTHIFYRYVIRAPRLRKKPGSLGQLLVKLEQQGIQCRRPVFRALHRYLELDGFPQSEEASETAISIPIYPSMTDEDVSRTAQALCEVLA